MDALTITLIVLAGANAAGIITTAIAGIYWNAKIREAKEISQLFVIAAYRQHFHLARNSRSHNRRGGFILL